MTVELWRQRGLGSAKVGTLRLADDGTVDFSGVTSADEEFLRGLCVVARGGERVEVTDGARWLDALPMAVRGSVIWAEAVVPGRARRSVRP